MQRPASLGTGLVGPRGAWPGWLRGGYFEMHPAIGLLLRRGSWERHLQTLAAQVPGTTRCWGSVKR